MSSSSMDARAQMIPSREFRVLMRRNGFKQKEKGTQAMLNDFLDEASDMLVKSASLHADNERKSTLKGSHAQRAMSEIRVFPSGQY